MKEGEGSSSQRTFTRGWLVEGKGEGESGHRSSVNSKYKVIKRMKLKKEKMSVGKKIILKCRF